MNRVIFLLCLLMSSSLSHSKTIPSEHARLHYNKVYFEEEFVVSASSYELIYFDSIQGSHRQHEIKQRASLPAFQTENLTWNTSYYWYVRAYTKSKKILSTTSIHHFDLIQVLSQNNEVSRLQITKNETKKHAGGFISLDYSRSIYDRQGNVIWTIPPLEWMHPQKNQIRDLKMTSDNTLTFLNGNFPLEIDLEGNILWSAPYPYTIQGDTVFYHHDFKKTNRGTYMVMGNKRAYRKVLGDYTMERLSKEFDVKRINGELYCKILLNILLEFNRKGELIWFWDANEYITDEDLNLKKGPLRIPSFATHANAFSENETGTKVYVGFRDLSRIVRVDKASKKVEQSYGEKYPSGEAQLGAGLFKRQHDAGITSRNTLLILNNNSPPGGGGGVSTVLEIKDVSSNQDSLVLWRFPLNFDTLSDGKSVSGGDVVELPNSDLLVCAGLLNRVFEVNRKKEVVWDAFVLAKSDIEVEWRNSPQYRCNWIKELRWYHFLVDCLPLRSKDEQLLVSLKIYNTCKHDDSYFMEVLDENGVSYLKEETKSLKSGHSMLQSLSVNASKVKSKHLRILIKSKHGSELKLIEIKN